MPDDITDLNNTRIGDPGWKVSAHWFYTRAAQAGLDSVTKRPFFVIPHRASIGTKVNDPRPSPLESKSDAEGRETNTIFLWHDDVPLGQPYRVMISASKPILSKPHYQELFVGYGPDFDFTI